MSPVGTGRPPRAAAVHFATSAAGVGSSIGTRLSADVRALFLAAGVARMTTADVLAGLLDADEASWGDLDELELVMVTAELHRVAVLGTAGPPPATPRGSAADGGAEGGSWL